jgi:hypothetical protein
MKILLISDTHGGLSAWNKALERAGRDVDYVVHCGDVCYHGPRNPLPSNYDPGGLVEALNACPYPLIMVRGNCDSDVDQMVLDWPLQDPFAFLQVGDLRLLATHGEKIPPAGFADLARKFRAQYVIFGHIHKPFLETMGERIIINPGSPSLSEYAPKGQVIQTAALLSDGWVEIFDIDTGRVVIGAPVE